MKRIDILTVTGSPRGVNPSEVQWPGVGGAELTLINLAKMFADHGWQVNVYNDSRVLSSFDGVNYSRVDAFNPQDDRDVLMTFRGPNVLAHNARYKKQIGLSTDQ